MAGGLPRRENWQKQGRLVGESPNVSISGLFLWPELFNSSTGRDGVSKGAERSVHEILFPSPCVTFTRSCALVALSRAPLSHSFSAESRLVSGRVGEVLFMGRPGGKELGSACLFCRQSTHPVLSQVLTSVWYLQVQTFSQVHSAKSVPVRPSAFHSPLCPLSALLSYPLSWAGQR